MRLSTRCMITLGAGMGMALMLTVGSAKFAQAKCGDGVTTAGEACDNGTALCVAPSKNIGAECSKSEDCIGASSAPHTGLAGDLCRCDTVAFPRGCNRDDVSNACRSTCMPPMCGDGVSDTGEQCDPGASTSTSGRCLGNVPNSVCANGAGLCHGGGGNPNALVGCTNDGQCAITPGCGGTCTGNPACTLAQCGDKFVCSDASCTSGNSPLNSPAGAPSPEACDDGNTSNMDSCNAFGFSFVVAGAGLVPDQCQGNLCGDGATNMGVEECDAGLSVCISGPKATVPPSKPCCTNDDCGLGSVTGICSNAVAPGNSNNPGNAAGTTCRCSCKFPSCGDGISDSALGEQCDDGTTQNGPGKFCNKVHRCVGGENQGALCTDNSTCTKGHCGPLVCEENVCGDDTVGGMEMCDDSNTVLASGSSDTCGVSPTTAAAINAVLKPGCNPALTGALANQPTACIQANCALPFCGDGITNAGEMCDAGASTCSAAAAATAGVTLFNDGAQCCTASDCKTTKTAAGVAPDVCGGSPFNASGSGNRNDLPNRCRCTCMPPSCGDGVSDTGEQCEPPASGTFCIKNATGMCVLNTCGDDDVCNKTAIDAATKLPHPCTSGPTCVTDPTTGAVTCTLGGGNEQCDDSNTVNPSSTNTDTCSNICQAASCGDGVTEVGEQCDSAGMGCSNMLLAGDHLAPDCCIDGEVVGPSKQLAPGLISVDQGLNGLNCRMANLIGAASCDAWLMKILQRANSKIVLAEIKLETDDITGAARALQQAYRQLNRLAHRITRVTQPGKACAGEAKSLGEQQANAAALTIGVASHLTEEVAIGFGP